MTVGQLAVSFAVISVCANAFDELTVRLIRDFQLEFNSNWLIILVPDNNSGMLDRNQILKTKRTSLTYVSVFTSKDLLQLEDKKIFATSPIILFRDLNNVLQSQVRIFNHFPAYYRFIWIGITNQNLSDELESVNVPFNCQFIVCRKFPDLQIFELMEIYKTSSLSRIFSDKYGTWNANEGLRTVNGTFLQRRMNFHGQNITVCNKRDGTDNPFAKTNFLPEIWQNVEKRLNIVSNYVEKENYDFSIYHNIMHGASDPNYEYIHSLISFRIHLFYKAIDERTKLTSYLLPFSTSLWVFIIIWVFVASFFMNLTTSKTFYKQQNIPPGFVYQFLNVVAVLSQQGVRKIFVSHAERILEALNLLVSFILFGFYSALFFSFITVVSHKSPFSELSLEGVLRQGEYKILLMRERRYPLFKKNQHPTIRALLKHQVPPYEHQPETFEQGFQKVCYGSDKYLSEHPPAIINEMRLKFQKCSISRESIPLNVFHVSWLFKRGYPYKAMIQLSMLKLTEAGMNGKVLVRHSNFQSYTEIKTVDPISFNHVILLFVIHCFGLVLAFLIFLSEIVEDKRKSKSSNIQYRCY